VTFEVKDQGRKVTLCVWKVLVDKSRTRNIYRNTKLVGRLPTQRAIMCTSFKVNGQRSRSPGRLMLRPEMRHIFRTERPYERETWYTDGPQRHVSPTSAMSTNVKSQGRNATRRVWQVLAHKSRTKSHRNTEIGIGSLPTPRAIKRASFKACEVGFLLAGGAGAYRVGRTQRSSNLIYTVSVCPIKHTKIVLVILYES